MRGDQSANGVAARTQYHARRRDNAGGAVASVTASEAFVGRGLCYEQIVGVQYRCFEAIWRVRQQWQVSGGLIA